MNLSHILPKIFGTGTRPFADAPPIGLLLPEKAMRENAQQAPLSQSPSQNEALFALRGVSKTFKSGVQALRQINLDIQAGEIFGIIGRSGAGKSTLLRVLNQLERPSEGQVFFEGRDLMSLSADELRQLRRRIGMIFQHFNLLSARTVADNIALPLELIGLPKQEIAKRVAALLELVGLSALRDRYPSQISGGQKQRVGIARALATEPRVLLCDEATSALDPETTQSILALLADINKRLGLTIILITHQMQVIKDVAHRVAVFDEGYLVEQGSVADIFTQAQHEITRSLLKEVIGNDIPATVHERARRIVREENGRIWRLSLRGELVDRSILSDVAAQCGLKIHLLHGYIDEIQNVPFASLLVAANGSAQNLQHAAALLLHEQIVLEEISV